MSPFTSTPITDEWLDDVRRRALEAHAVEKTSNYRRPRESAVRLRRSLVAMLRQEAPRQEGGRRVQMEDLAATLEALR